MWLLINAVLVVGLAILGASIHRVSEGHIAVYYRGGKLLSEYSEAGFNFRLPFVTQSEEVQITIQTDAVTNIPCGTRGGVMISFDKVEVVNRLNKKHAVETIRRFGLGYDKMLVFNKIHHEINQFCSRHSLQEVYIDLFDTIDESLMATLQSDCERFNTGIDIIAVRVTKPKIPESIRRNYEEMEAKRTQLLVAMEHRAVVENEALTEKKRMIIEANRQLEVSRIQKQQEIYEKQAQKKVALLNDTMYLAREKARADSYAYNLKSMAHSHKALLSPDYLQYQYLLALKNLTKIYFGQDLKSFEP